MDLFKEQAEIEARMADRGIERYHRLAQEAAQGGEATRSKSVQTVLESAVVAVEEGIKAFLLAAQSGKAGRRHTAVKRLQGIDPGEAAFVTMRVVLDGMSTDRPVTAVALSIGSALELEARMAKLAEAHPAYVKTLMTDLDGRTRHVGHRRAVLSRVLREKGDAWEDWGKRDILNTGLKLIELAVETTGLFAVKVDRDGRTQLAVLHATPRFKDWLHSLDTRFALMSPEYLPCVIPPKDWTDFQTGGYHSDALAYPPTLVKTSDKRHKAALRGADLSAVLSSVNAIQRTPWAINTRVLGVVEELVEARRALGGLPPLDDTPLPGRPDNIDTDAEALKQWKREAARTYAENRKLTGRRIGILRSVQVAQDFAKYPAIYFPHQLDFRGRVYPIPQGLNPQGNDLGKALLHFSEGDPLDTAAAVRWFKVHGANCFGVDKVSMDDRMQWVDDNAEHIIRSAEDPFGYQWWADADSPFCFLAWAFEFSEWAAQGCPEAFLSRIPVAMDGSCNGLQHYSAMLRDPRGGAATNLRPADKPQDIYGEVAKVVMRNLARAAHAEEDAEKKELARKWLGYGIDRKITKRPVMVLPYGGTQRSCFDYTYDAVKERGDYPFKEEELHKATVFLGGVIWAAIGEVVVAARLAMSWLRSAAAVVSKENVPIKWTTPSGFPVLQSYMEVKNYQVDCVLFGVRFQPRLDARSSTEIDKRRQANGVAPNFVHSLDAAALTLTVNHAAGRGVSNFAMIHDSYGTSARSASTLAESLRDAFVEMYDTSDVLAQFLHDAVPGHLKEAVPDRPFVGGLDLNEVRKSPYFFA